MAETESQIRELFASSSPNIPQDVLHELLSITRLLSLDPQELFYKWESYVLKMGTENTKLEYKTAKDFKKDLQDALERESRAKGQHAAPRKAMAATPRAGANGGDMFDMLGGAMSTTPRNMGSAKRKAGEFQTPTSKAAKNGSHGSPTTPMAASQIARTPGMSWRLSTHTSLQRRFLKYRPLRVE
jgi:DNA polymerase alpha subunit B